MIPGKSRREKKLEKKKKRYGINILNFKEIWNKIGGNRLMWWAFPPFLELAVRGGTISPNTVSSASSYQYYSEDCPLVGKWIKYLSKILF